MKKNLFLFALVIFSFLFGKAQIIVDHTSTNLLDVPTQWVDSAKHKLHIAYGYTSHGSQLVYGMYALTAFVNGGGLGLSLPQDFYNLNNGGSDNALDFDDNAMSGDVGYYPEWIDNTRSYLGSPDPITGRGTGANADVNVIIWSWCGQVSSHSENSMINQYLEPMAQLESDYPGVKFVYMTGHLDGSGVAGNLHIRNEQIRNYCHNNGKILYDFADIESYDPDGLVNYMPLFANDNCDYDSDGDGTLDTNWALNWQNSHTLNVDWYECSAAHSQSLNGNQKAYAAWHLWARIAGWNGQTGVNEQVMNSLLKVYPNPAVDFITIEPVIADGFLKIEILNATGQLVYRDNLYGKTRVNCADFSPGFYLLKVDDGNSIEVIKIVKE